MAITYHAGRRIQGLEYVTQTATLTNAEDSGSWTGSGSLSITSGELQVRLGGSNAGVAQRDITSVNSSSWVMRWKWEQTGTQTNASPNDMRCMIGLASNAGSFGGNSPTYGSTSGDHIGMYMDVGHIHFVAFNGTTPSAQSTSSSMINFTGAPFTKYCEIIRDGSSFTLNIFDSSTFTGTKLTRSLSYTGMTSLRYIGGQAGWYGGGGGIQANMSEITFYDGITSAMPTGDVKPTNVQTGSRFEETDTRKMYHYEAGSVIETLDSTNGTASWNVDNGGSDITIDTSNNEIDITGTGQKSGYYDLGTSVSASSWLLRFKITSSGSPTGNPLFWVGLFDVNTIDSRNTNVDGISIMMYTGANYYLSMKNGSHMDSGGTQTLTSPTVSADTTTRYVEIVRNGSNAILTFYNSDTYLTSIGTVTVAITGSAFRYLCAISYFEGSGRTYSLSNVKFYNGTTTTVIPAAWTEEGT